MKSATHSPFGTVAIVGIGGLYPEAPDLDRFWKNILEGHTATREVPQERWAASPERLFSPEVAQKDRVYSRRGCFIASIPRTVAKAGMDSEPGVPAGLDPLFHLLLHAGKQAFADGITSPLDRSRVGVIIGNLALPTEKSSQLSREILTKTIEEKLFGRSSSKSVTSPLNSYVAGLPAGLLAYSLGLGGGSCTLDAACASSLYAIKLAVDELLSGRADAMLSGGVSRPDPLFTQMGFSQLRALSKRGICSPFDADGDGLVVGEGAGIFLLKRTEDAIAHGDRIYGIIRGIGLANDVGGSLLAPMSEGQLRAMRRAYDLAGLHPVDMDMIECHATGTPVGDATEVASMKELWGANRIQGSSCVIGSVKSNIGHLLTAAGSAALTKTLLAMRTGILPPTASFNRPQPGMDLENSPFEVLKTPRSWERRGDGIPRRAAVSAFGFGGINAHLLLEEWLPEVADIGETIAVSQNWLPDPSDSATRVRNAGDIAVVGMDARFGAVESLQGFQEQTLAGIPPEKLSPEWWGAETSTWFLNEAPADLPLKGNYLRSASLPSDQFRIPPLEIQEMLPQQILMLQSAAAAFEDAGLDRSGNLNTGVFIGIALDLNSTNFGLRWTLPDAVAGWKSRDFAVIPEAELADWTDALKNAVSPHLSANRTMGALGNIVASRIVREFKCGGPGFTLSSEESSGLRALATAARQLQQGEIDKAVVGAVDFAGDLRAVLGRAAAQPGATELSGEGAAAVVLKRLEDAKADGNRIYAVIRGIGFAGGEVLDPGKESCGTSFIRACTEAEVNPGSIDFIETAPGNTVNRQSGLDALEVLCASNQMDNSLLSNHQRTALGSLHGIIGHSGAASGLASFVRASLALYQEIIPASPAKTSERLNPFFYTPSEPRYWLRNRISGVRHACVSSIGVDGTTAHIILSGHDSHLPHLKHERTAPLGSYGEYLFIISGNSTDAIAASLLSLTEQAHNCTEDSIAILSSEWNRTQQSSSDALALTIVTRSVEELPELLKAAGELLRPAGDSPLLHPNYRDRIFFSPAPLGPDARIAFVFPGSGNHFANMGLALSCRWPEIYRQQDDENLYLRSQFQPEIFWNGAPADTMDNDHRAVIFGQVATGCAVSDIVSSFGIVPSAVIGYSLGESAGLFATRAWKERDSMLLQMYNSTLFTHDLAGECRAASRAWGLPEGKSVDWLLGVVSAPAREVRRAIRMTTRVYLLIVNTPNECVIGGDAKGVKRVVAILGCSFFQLSGVTTVHCEVAREVAESYRNLHLFPTDPPAGITYYSGAEGSSFDVNRESAADAILAQALEGINYPAVINSAYGEGTRIFIEMGPGASCSRMIDQILDGKPHLARSACTPQLDGEGAILRLLAGLIAERVPVDISRLLTRQHQKKVPLLNNISVASGKSPLQLPVTPVTAAAPRAAFSPLIMPGTPALTVPSIGLPPAPVIPPAPVGSSSDTLLHEYASAQDARIKAHETYLQFSETVSRSMAHALSLQATLQQSLGGEAILNLQSNGLDVLSLHSSPDQLRSSFSDKPSVFNRTMCMEFAIGSVARMLGEKFSEADSFPTRVRLPDEPLMLVDRITTLEGEPKSMTSGRVVTEHDIHPGAWYLDGGRIPTCIAVEAGQADLFLSGYLGIDFITRGMAVYRLLDAVVTFHRGLPGPGEVISYDIHIKHFFRQGDTWLFRFFFEATVNGEPLLSMRDGCAGFFSAAELEAGKGIVRPAVDMRPTSGIRPSDWVELVPMETESLDAARLAALRRGDLAAAFGSRFARLPVAKPLTIPAGRMELVHRVMEIQPRGGRYREGFIRAEADIHPDDWFITCHFVDDRVMPGTLMYECCMHTLRIFLLRMGWVAEADRAVFEPVPGVASGLKCRGQVLETTKVVTYEVTIRELGYRPEPYVICDALMYADGKPIVEISNMSARLTGTTRDQLLALWQRQTAVPADIRKPAVYDKQQILAYSNGNPSEGFGDRYRMFDAGMERKIARLPGPPFQFMDRVTAVKGEPWVMAPGAFAEAQYDIPVDDWFFAADRQPRMPFCVLLEAALQPCGWLAAYVGSALQSDVDISFRNLGGSAVQHRPVTPERGTITCSATLKKAATSGGMIIQEFDFTVADSHGLIYEGETMFGFFSKEALANQVGIRDAKPYLPTAEEIRRGRAVDYPVEAPFPEKKLRMIDVIELYVPDGGPKQLGYLRGIKHVDPDEWFFKAHFYEDPVTPGSLGLESFEQLLKFAAFERWGLKDGEIFEAAAIGMPHKWLYRGQIIPANRKVTVEAWITTVDDSRKIITGSGYLSVDGKTIYQMIDFTVGIVTV